MNSLENNFEYHRLITTDTTPFVSRPKIKRSPQKSDSNNISELVSSFFETPSRRLAPKDFKEYLKNIKSPTDKPVPKCIHLY